MIKPRLCAIIGLNLFRASQRGDTMEKKQPKKQIKIKQDPHAEALKRAPEEVVAKAIHEMLVKDKERK